MAAIVTDMLLTVPSRAEVTCPWAAVGDAGNVFDRVSPEFSIGYGAVAAPRGVF